MKPVNLLKPCLLTAALMLFAACSDDPVVDPAGDAAGVSLSISCAERGAISRATPGLDMPFSEYGNDYESKISDALIVIYTHPINSGQGTVAAVVKLNSADLGDGNREWGSPTADNSYYDNNGTKHVVASGMTYHSARRHDVKDITALNQVILNKLPANTTYYAMAFANFGNNLDSQITEGMSETALRDLVYTGPLFTDKSYYAPQPTGATGSNITSYGVHREYEHFAMSAVNEVKFTTPQINSANAPFSLGDFYVQRLAARVDICFGVQATQYTDKASADAEYSWLLHYANMTWQNFQVDYNAAWDGLYKYDMDVPSESATGYPPGGLYRFPIFDEDEYQRNKATEGENFAEDHGEIAHRLPNGIWFWLENIEILNAVSTGEYLLQHSTGTPTYMGHEGAWNNGYPANFISSPSRTIVDRNLTPEPSGSPTASNSSLPDEQRVKVRPVPYIQSMLTGTDDACHTIHEYHARYDRDNSIAPYRDFERKFHVSSILGYVGENTYATYADGNKYTAIRLTGKTNMPLSFTGEPNNSYRTMSVVLLLRHSYGTPNLGQPLCYGVVRNTIYKVFLRFFGSGENLRVRYWYYNGDNNNNNYNLTEAPYGEGIFTSIITETDGTNVAVD